MDFISMMMVSRVSPGVNQGFMNYSDEKFEAFSNGLAGKISRIDLLWLTRDALFNAITYRSSSKKKVPV
jgi:hypothetical protein